MIERIAHTIETHDLADSKTPVLLMVSGGSDSTALAYIAAELASLGMLGEIAMLHVNHKLRGADAEADAAFVHDLAEALGLPFFLVEVDVGGIARQEGANTEAIARRERYAAAQGALESLCRHALHPIGDGRIFTAHTQDDRVENFYMRSIVGTGPGGFRSMRYRNGSVVRPCLGVSRQDLRDYLKRRALDVEAGEGKPLVRDSGGNLWREDATNAHTDLFRGYVRHEIVPKALERNPRLLQTLSRTMDLIADEDDMLDAWTAQIVEEHVSWESAGDPCAGCVIAPGFAAVELPLQRRAAIDVLKRMLGVEERVDAASVEAIVAAFADGAPISGYTNNIQGDLALSANKRGLRIEPMSAYRARRKGIR